MPQGDHPWPLLLEVGRIVKPHGLSGEVVVELWTDRTERLAPGSVLVTDLGDVEIVRSRPHRDRHLVTLAGVADRPGADRLRGVVLRAAPLDVPGVMWVHELVGSEVETVDGRVVGRVSAVEPNPASDLLVIDDGSLVPLRFVVDRTGDGRVLVDVPDGLLD